MASDVARDFCVAEHFQGKQVPPATVRFSNGSEARFNTTAVRTYAEWRRDSHLADGVAHPSLIAMTLGEFFTPTVESFLRASRRAPTKPIPLQVRDPARPTLLDTSRSHSRRCPIPVPDSTMSPIPARCNSRIDTATLKFPVFQGRSLGAPTSYVARLITPCIRLWSWRPTAPAAGFASLGNPSPGFSTPIPRRRRSRNICNRNCATASRGSARALHSDDVDRRGRRRFQRSLAPVAASSGPSLVMGTLTIDAVPEDQVENCERLSFNPWRLVPGSSPRTIRSFARVATLTNSRAGGAPEPHAHFRGVEPMAIERDWFDRLVDGLPENMVVPIPVGERFVFPTGPGGRRRPPYPAARGPRFSPPTTFSA